MLKYLYSGVFRYIKPSFAAVVLQKAFCIFTGLYGYT